jgi:hypothetical protein
VFVRQAVRQRRIPFEISLGADADGSAAAVSGRIWQESIRNGTGQMAAAEIDAEIATARRDRREHAVDAKA